MVNKQTAVRCDTYKRIHHLMTSTNIKIIWRCPPKVLIWCVLWLLIEPDYAYC